MATLTQLFLLATSLFFLPSQGLDCCVVNTTLGQNALDFNQLYQWCIANTACSSAYFQDIRNNHTLFNFLIMNNVIPSFTYMETPLTNILCNASSTQDSIKTLWLLYMTLWQLTTPLCPANHIFQVDSLNTSSGKCVCVEDRLCADCETLSPFVSGFLFLICVLMFVYIGISIAGLSPRNVSQASSPTVMQQEGVSISYKYR